MKKMAIILGSIVVLVIVVLLGMQLKGESAEKELTVTTANPAPETKVKKLPSKGESAKSESTVTVSKPIPKTEAKKLPMQSLLSPQPIEESFIYQVQPGDTLAKIAKKFNTTFDLIAASNQLHNPNMIRAGQKLKIIKGEFKIIIDISDNALSLFLDHKLVKIYSVGSGKPGNSTPTGEFKIINKQINPTWYPPEGGVYPYGHPKNTLGTRWMGISKQGYGIHGTTEPETIDQYVSRGCIRMYNKDIEELFKIVPIDTKVIIAK